jgi:hypothetical protein
MKITIDTAQTPQALLNEFTQAIRFALGPRFYIEESDSEQPTNFTATELVDPNVNLAPLNTAAVAPTAQPAASAGAAPGAAETDSAGDVWDVRIHSAGKSKIAAGTWKLKKGVDKSVVEQITAQNRQLLATPLPSAAPALTVVPGGLPALPAAGAVAAMPALPDLPPVAQVAAPDVEIVVTDYPTFAQFAAQQMVAKPVAAKRELDKGLTHYGMVDANGKPDITALQHRPEVVMPLYGWFKAVVDLCTE